MAYLTRHDLALLKQDAGFRMRAQEGIQRSASTAEVTIFLSHSHEDQTVVQDIADFLRAYGGRAYIDWQDATLPHVICAETADRLRSKIRQHQRFILVATANARASRWVPWELGCADGAIHRDRIAMLPLTNSRTSWDKNEYMGLYPYIASTGQGKDWGVFPPGGGLGCYLRDWLHR